MNWQGVTMEGPDLCAEYAEYKKYISSFAETIDPLDQLPLRVSGYCKDSEIALHEILSHYWLPGLARFEIHGEILDWIMNYLG